MKKDDNARLLFSTGILASLFGYLQVYDKVSDTLGAKPALWGLITILSSGALSLLFILLCANRIRFEDEARWPFAKYNDTYKQSIEWLRKTTYDLSIDMFILAPVTVAATYVTLTFLSISVNNSAFDLILIFLNLLLIGLMVWLMSIIIQILYRVDKFLGIFEDRYLARLFLLLALGAIVISILIQNTLNWYGIAFLSIFIVITMGRIYLDIQQQKRK